MGGGAGGGEAETSEDSIGNIYLASRAVAVSEFLSRALLSERLERANIYWKERAQYWYRGTEEPGPGRPGGLLGGVYKVRRHRTLSSRQVRRHVYQEQEREVRRLQQS